MGVHHSRHLWGGVQGRGMIWEAELLPCLMGGKRLSSLAHTAYQHLQCKTALLLEQCQDSQLQSGPCSCNCHSGECCSSGRSCSGGRSLSCHSCGRHDLSCSAARGEGAGKQQKGTATVFNCRGCGVIAGAALAPPGVMGAKWGSCGLQCWRESLCGGCLDGGEQ